MIMLKPTFQTLLLFLLSSYFCLAQLPADLPWQGELCQGENRLLQSGIAGLTCAVSINLPPNQRWTFGLVNIDGALPGSGRIEATATQAVYHHPSWQVEELGNVFGIAMNRTNGCVLVAASSNYAAAFSSTSASNPAILNYGNIGGGPNTLAAAGTVYKIDSQTGQATVFAQLPQQFVEIRHYDCEQEQVPPFIRTSGVGLGNVTYDETHDQYFVSNIEDGRIYRLSNTGVILDSYDPLIYDDGAPGVTDLTDLAYGLAVTDDGSRLFFGTIITPNGGFNNAGTGNVPIYSIDILPTGGFAGTVNNAVLPAGVPNNYVGTETFQTTIPVGGGLTFTTNTTFQVSDLHFDANGNLLVGVRVGCLNTFQSNYLHYGETNIVMPDANGIYNIVAGEYDISIRGDAGVDDNYGGVASWELPDGSGDIQYLATSGDILNEVGPHGIAIFESTASTTAQVDPLAAISYGVLTNDDPKGVGGDVEVFGECCLISCIVTVAEIPNCGFADGSITATGTGAKNDNYLYSLDAFATAGQTSGSFTSLAGGTYTVTIRDADAPGCESICEIELLEDQTPKCTSEIGPFTFTKRIP